jgi:hypothetical protein
MRIVVDGPYQWCARFLTSRNRTEPPKNFPEPEPNRTVGKFSGTEPNRIAKKSSGTGPNRTVKKISGTARTEPVRFGSKPDRAHHWSLCAKPTAFLWITVTKLGYCFLCLIAMSLSRQDVFLQ